MGYIEASHSENLGCVGRNHVPYVHTGWPQFADLSGCFPANCWKLDFPAERVFHVTMNAVAKQQYYTSILHTDVNCVLIPFIYLGCHVLCHRNSLGHHTESNSLAFLRGERQSMADKKCYNQKFEPI